MNKLITETTCEICGVVERRDGQPQDLPRGWKLACACPKHLKVVKKVRGKDRKPRVKAQDKQGEASVVKVEEITITDYGTKVPASPAFTEIIDDIKASLKPSKVKVAHQKRTETKPTPAHRNCVSCKDEAGCFKDGTEALDCWAEKNKSK